MRRRANPILGVDVQDLAMPALPPGFLAVVTIPADGEDVLILTEVSEARSSLVPELLRGLGVVQPVS